jgi:transcriptional regulator with XRE-family HTH domain
MKESKRKPAAVGVLYLGPLLTAWHDGNGWPLKKIANDLNIKMSTWSRWKKGKRFPAPDQIQSLADYVGVPVCRFFCHPQWRCARYGRPAMNPPA